MHNTEIHPESSYFLCCMTKITEGYVETANDSLTEEKHCNVIQRKASQHEDFGSFLGDEKQPLRFTPSD